MWPFTKRAPVEVQQYQQPPNLEGMAALGEAFARTLAASIEGNAKIAGVFSQFIGQMAELSTRQAARVLGQRSASTRARNPKGKFLPKKKASDCPLCDNPMARNVTIAIINAHRSHEAGVEEAPGPDAPGSDPSLTPGVPTELGN